MSPSQSPERSNRDSIQPTLELELVATTNPGKLAEYERMLGRRLQGIEVEIPELQPTKAQLSQMTSGDYAEVATNIAAQKARAAYAAQGKPVLIDDTCLFFSGLEGRPGPLMASFVTEAWLQNWCGLIHDLSKNHEVVAVTTLAIFTGQGEPQTRHGIAMGFVAGMPRGTGGFGWDRIFIPREQPAGSADLLTYAEMRGDQKDKISARHRALEALISNPFKP